MYDKNNWNQSILLESQAHDDQAIVNTNHYYAGFLPLNGTLTSGGNYTNNIANFITIISSADETSNIFTVTGKDAAGRTWTISTPGANAGTITIEIPFQTINAENITMLNDSTGTISLGISVQNATVWIPLDHRRQFFSVGMDVWLSLGAALTYTVEYTKQSVRGPTSPTRIFADNTLNAQTTSGTTTESWPWTAVRLRFPTWTSGNAVFEMQQADDMHASHKQY